MLKRSSLVLCFALVSGCATIHNPMDGHTGEAVIVRDTGQQPDSSKAEIFALVEVDGKTIKNAIHETRKASNGRGNALRLELGQRFLPLRPMNVTLVATHSVAMPIHELASRAAGTFFEVTGTTRFVPQDGVTYEVTGTLAQGSTCVWIVNAKTLAPATEKICAKPGK